MPSSMSRHSVFSFFLFCGAGLLINFRSHVFVGLLHGARAESAAVEQRTSVEAAFANVSTTEEFCQRYDEAYFEPKSRIFRDAGTAAAIFALALFFLPNLTLVKLGRLDRLRLLILALPLKLVPAWVGQIVYQKSIPIELVLERSFKQIVQQGSYCSWLSFLGDAVKFPDDLEVIAIATALIMFIVVPSYEYRNDLQKLQ